jgi:hypothetical protein
LYDFVLTWIYGHFAGTPFVQPRLATVKSCRGVHPAALRWAEGLARLSKRESRSRGLRPRPAPMSRGKCPRDQGGGVLRILDSGFLPVDSEKDQPQPEGILVPGARSARVFQGRLVMGWQTGLDKRGPSKMPLNPPYNIFNCIIKIYAMYVHFAETLFIQPRLATVKLGCAAKTLHGPRDAGTRRALRRLQLTLISDSSERHGAPSWAEFHPRCAASAWVQGKTRALSA